MAAKCYTEYQKRLHQNQALDFDDLIMQTIRLFRENKETLAHYQEKFQYIHVDEYQDTNEAQYTLVNMLAEKYQNLCVVGDADQSIYGWRGADISNIMNFEHDYPDAKSVMLEQNYRSTKTILEAANGVINRNTFRKPKELWTQNEEANRLRIIGARVNVTNLYLSSRRSKKKCKKITVNTATLQCFIGLMRNHGRLKKRSLKLICLIKWSADTNSTTGKKLRISFAYLRLVVNAADSMSFERIVNSLNGGLALARSKN